MKINFDEIVEGDVLSSHGVLLRVIKKDALSVMMEDMSAGIKDTVSKENFTFLHAEKR